MQSKRAKEELKMVFTDPETLNVFLNLNNRSILTRSYKKYKVRINLIIVLAIFLGYASA